MNKLAGEFVAEVFGTFILVLLGVGVVANVGLAPRTAPASYDWLLICIGWCFAVVIAVYAVAGVSGAHLNPAVTLAMAVKRGFPWNKVLPFWAAQMIGAFLGALGVYLSYRDGLIAAGLPNVFTTGPGSVFSTTYWGAEVARQSVGSYSILTATTAEALGTAVLLWGILAAFDERNIGVGRFGPLIVGFAVLVVGTSLGGASGFAINPARDLGSRILADLVGSKGVFDGVYWMIAPILGPFIGGILGIYAYDLCVTPFLPPPQK
jgi:glycerol uptake facilitator protein